MKKTFFLVIAVMGLVAYTAGAQTKADSRSVPPSVTCPKPGAYKPRPAPQPLQPALPPIPANVTPPIKVGNDFTVRGAMHHLRSRVHADEIIDKRMTIVGYIVKINYSDVPKCAVHRTGKADPPNCTAPLPTFWIADEKGESSAKIMVMGWAANFAQVYTLIEAIDNAPEGKSGEVQLVDEFWAHTLPNPLPNVGAKVKITGVYGPTFTKASSGMAADGRHGIITYEAMEYIERPGEKAYLPGMKRKP